MRISKEDNNREVMKGLGKEETFSLTPRDLIYLRVIVGVFLRKYIINSADNPELKSIQEDVVKLHQKINTLIRII